MKVIINLQLLVLVIASCSPSKYTSKEMEGLYKQKDNANIKLILNENNFAYTDAYTNDLALYTCCDTITKGVWIQEKDWICLSTPQLQSSIISMNVKESSMMDKDTLYFYLANPVEEYYKKYRVKNRDIVYRVSMSEKNGNILGDWTQEYNSSIIKILKPKELVITKFSISIYPKANFGGRNIGTKQVSTIEYQIKNESSNLFEISIPQLSYEFMSYLRLNKDFIRIVNKNKLEWDGVFYLKEPPR